MRAIGRWALLAALWGVAMQPNIASATDVRALTAAYNASGDGLFRELAAKPGNLVLSPYSIGAAMAMARSGARGETEREMAKALKHTLGREAADAANWALLQILNDYGKDTHQPVKLATANALMLAKRADLISQDYRNLVAERYAAAIHHDAGLAEINGWVKDKTEGKIDRILDALPDDAAAVLLNAIYLKAGWASTFPEGATRKDDFKLSEAQVVRVSMMRQQRAFRVVDGDGYRAIRLDYTAPALGMIVVLPNEIEGADAVARALDAGALDRLRSALRDRAPSLAALALPRFKTAFKAGLIEPFQKAGMTRAFTDNADFGGMTGRSPGQEGVKIGNIQHRATIEVTEQGTEAAAATAVEMRVAGAAPRKDPPRPIPFVVDHPFLFYVVDDASGAVLFQGRVVDPR